MPFYSLPTGASPVLAGDGAPTGGVGNVGDLFLDRAGRTLYGPKENTGWPTGIALAITGPAGPSVTGPTGVQGPAGVGVTGATGSTGPQGISITGPTGPASTVPGPTGPQTSISIGVVTQGSTPSASLTGPAGAQVLSLVLARGATGPSGSPGSTGPIAGLAIGTVQDGGSAGASIYPDNAGGYLLDLTLPRGPTGNASTVPGPTGAAGPQGLSITGPQGPQGQAGPTGSTGPAGQSITGPTGERGATGPAGSGGGDGTDSVLRAIFVPPAPTSVTATAGDAQASLAWTAPTGVISQAPITDYAVQFSSNSGSTWTTFSDGTSTSASTTVTGLSNGTGYTFRVAAVNAVGQGAWSSASSSVTPAAAGGTFTAIPLMTSATTPSGAASADATLDSSEVDGRSTAAWRAFDKTTVSSGDNFYASARSPVGRWVQYDFGSGSTSSIGGYSFTAWGPFSNYPINGANAAPVGWTLSGSSDGTNFTTIDTRTSQSFSAGQTQTFTLSQTATYRVFRWTWTASPSSGFIALPKIQLVAP